MAAVGSKGAQGELEQLCIDAKTWPSFQMEVSGAWLSSEVVSNSKDNTEQDVRAQEERRGGVHTKLAKAKGYLWGAERREEGLAGIESQY